MKPTNKLLIMSGAATPFFEGIELEEVGCYGARVHTCDREGYWKNVSTELDWKEAMLLGAGDLIYEYSQYPIPNYALGCGHNAYDIVFPVFTSNDIINLLHGSDNGYFNVFKNKSLWNKEEPIEMVQRITKIASTLFWEYFHKFKSFEEFMLAFYMLEIHNVLWNDKKEKWIKE